MNLYSNKSYSIWYNEKYKYIHQTRGKIHKKSLSLLSAFCCTILLFSSCKNATSSSSSDINTPPSLSSIDSPNSNIVSPSYPNTVAMSDEISITFLTDIVSYLEPSTITTAYNGLSSSTLTDDYLYFINYENYESDEDFVSSIFRYDRSTQVNEKILEASEGNFFGGFAVFENGTLFIKEEKSYDGLYTYSPPTFYYYNLSSKEKTPISEQLQTYLEESSYIPAVYDNGFILDIPTGESDETTTYRYIENNKVIKEFSFTKKIFLSGENSANENQGDEPLSFPSSFFYQDTIFYYDADQGYFLLMNPRLEKPVPAFSYSYSGADEGFNSFFAFYGFYLVNVQEDFFLSLSSSTTQQVINLKSQTFVGQENLSVYFFNTKLTENGFFAIPRNWEPPAEGDIDFDAFPYVLYDWDEEPIEFYERNGTLPEIHTISLDKKNVVTGIGYTDQYHTQAVTIVLNPIPRESVSQDTKDLFERFTVPYFTGQIETVEE